MRHLLSGRYPAAAVPDVAADRYAVAEAFMKRLQLAAQRFQFGHATLRVRQFVGDGMAEAGKLNRRRIAGVLHQLPDLSQRKTERLGALNERYPADGLRRVDPIPRVRTRRRGK